MKESWKPGTLIYPLPAVLVSCGATPDEYNLLTVAWTGTVCTDPPMCYVSVRPERHSYGIIRRTGEFVINLTTRGLARAADWCGVRSGRDYDKFREMGLTPGKALKVAAPIVEESPVSIECRVRQVLELGTHDMFLAEVVAVQVDADYIDPATGRFCLERACPIVYSHGEYFALGEALGHFGWSVRKKPRPKTSKSVAGTKPVTGTKSLTGKKPVAGTKLVAKTKSLTGTKPASGVESADRTSSALSSATPSASLSSSASAMPSASASSAAVSSLASSSSSASPSSSASAMPPASALSSSASSAALSAGPNSDPNQSRNSSRNPKRNPDRRQGRKSGPEKPRRR
ncbi:MAG: flavin reductase family protein [Alistipes sp.]|nr:flavin reductase family protein [Alistipes sp.]